MSKKITVILIAMLMTGCIPPDTSKTVAFKVRASRNGTEYFRVVATDGTFIHCGLDVDGAQEWEHYEVGKTYKGQWRNQ